MNAEILLLVVPVVVVVVLAIVSMILPPFGFISHAIFVALIVSVVGGFFSVGYGVTGVLNRHSCGVKADGLGLEAEWSYAGNCRVRDGDRWVDIEQYRFALEK